MNEVLYRGARRGHPYRLGGPMAFIFALASANCHVVQDRNVSAPPGSSNSRLNAIQTEPQLVRAIKPQNNGPGSPRLVVGYNDDGNQVTCPPGGRQGHVAGSRRWNACWQPVEQWPELDGAGSFPHAHRKWLAPENMGRRMAICARHQRSLHCAVGLESTELPHRMGRPDRGDGVDRWRRHMGRYAGVGRHRRSAATLVD